MAHGHMQQGTVIHAGWLTSWARAISSPKYKIITSQSSVYIYLRNVGIYTCTPIHAPRTPKPNLIHHPPLPQQYS